MANTQEATWAMVLKIVETIDVSVGAAEFLVVTPDPTQIHQISGMSGALDGSTTPPITKAWSSRVEIAGGGTETINLAALPGQSAISVDMEGLELILFLFKNNGDDAMIVADAAATGYPLFGSATGQITVPGGGAHMFYTANGIGTDIEDGVAMNVAVVGTATETFDILIGCG